MTSESDPVLLLVGALYDAALDPGLWPTALDQLADLTGSQFAHLFYIDPRTGPSPVFTAVSERAPDASLNRYHTHYEALDPRRAAGDKQPAGTVVPDWSIVPQEEFVQGEFYNEFYSPLGLRWLACGTAVRSESLVACLGLTRGVRDDAYTKDVCRWANRIMPHLARAVAIHHRLGGIETATNAGFRALDPLQLGVIVLDERARPIFMNRAVERIIAEQDGLRYSASTGVTAEQHDETRALQAAIGRVISLEEILTLRDCDVVRVTRPSLRRPYLILAAPAASRSRLVRRESGAMAYLIVQDPDRRVQPCAELVSILHRLTPAEADVASRLAAGYSLPEIAEQRGSSLHTVRWLLKQAMAKTDTRSQAALVSLVLASAAALAP